MVLWMGEAILLSALSAHWLEKRCMNAVRLPFTNIGSARASGPDSGNLVFICMYHFEHWSGGLSSITLAPLPRGVL